MDDEARIINCRSESVLSFDSGIYKAEQIFRFFQNLRPELGKFFYENLRHKEINIKPDVQRGLNALNYKQFFYDGIKCEKLESNSDGWQRGRFKLTIKIEFVPDPDEDDMTRISKDISPDQELSGLDEFR
ncbi:MAG TPA: KGK domain-containing protein [Leptolyngbyaceae cyanobacterium]